DPLKIKSQGHQSEYERYDNGKSNTHAVNDSLVAVVVHTQGLKGTVKAMNQMPGKRKAAADIEDHHKRTLESLGHHLVEIQFALANGLRVTVRSPECSHVNDEENQNQAT